MNIRRIAQSISRCTEGIPARVQVYRVLVSEVAEPGALEQLWGIDRYLDREIVQWCRDHIADPVFASDVNASRRFSWLYPTSEGFPVDSSSESQV